MPRIGWLGFNAPETAPHQYAAFRQGLRDHGWVAGRNILIEYRWAGGRADRLPALAAELVLLDVDRLVTASSATDYIVLFEIVGADVVVGAVRHQREEDCRR